MKVAFVSDLHLGLKRFPDIARKQAEEALFSADELADVIVVSGDIFDKNNPSVDTLYHAMDTFSSLNSKVLVIPGNHDARVRGERNAVELLTTLPNVVSVDKRTERVGDMTITGLGYVPDHLAKDAIVYLTERERPHLSSQTSILVIHQNVSEFVLMGESTVSLNFLASLPFTYVVCGHHHQHGIERGKVVFPGSTVVTQLREDEVGERGFYVFDGLTWTFHSINAVPVRIEELKFNDADFNTVVERVMAVVSGKDEEEILRIVLRGSLQAGLSPSDLPLPKNLAPTVFIDNKLNSRTSFQEFIDELKESSVGLGNMKERVVFLLKKHTHMKVLDVEKLFYALHDRIGVDDI
jgi:DNA repair exonuclease SbcCD nuclease subunit